MTLGVSPGRRFSSSQMRSVSSQRGVARSDAAIALVASAAEVQRGASVDDNSPPHCIADHEKPIP
jgi:hypothetical protein